MEARARHRGKEYTHLLKDPEIKRWYENVARGSVITADVYLRRFGRFCEDYKVTPAKLLKLDDKKLHDLMLDVVTKLDSQGFAGSYIHSILKSVKSWLGFHGRTLNRKIKIKDASDTPSLRDERIPTREELKKILLSGDKAARVASILMAHSGFRPQVLGNYMGDGGLRLKDISGLKITNEGVKFETLPATITVRKELSKAGHVYFTFLSEEGAEYLQDYLTERMRDGEVLTSDSPIIRPKTTKKDFITTINIGDLIRNAIRRAGFPWRPYVLRSYFDTQLMLAESKGMVLRDYRTFWMGHKGDIEHTYTTNKGRLSTDVIESMREAYTKSQEFLQTKVSDAPNESEITRVFRIQFLHMFGCTDKEIDGMDIEGMAEEEMMKLVRERILGVKSNGNNHSQQKSVSLDELDKYLEDGWEYVTTLANQKVIVRLPS